MPSKDFMATRRNYPPPKPGEKRNLQHGAVATPDPRRQRKLEAEILSVLPVTDEHGNPHPSDAIATRLLAIALVRLESCTKYVTRNGQFTKAGKLTAAAEWEDKLSARCMRIAGELGLTPAARVKLNLQERQADAIDLAALLSDAPDARTPPRKRKQLGEPIQDATVVDDD
jgi:hypothetical protein